jgi:hypothetical protein
MVYARSATLCRHRRGRIWRNTGGSDSEVIAFFTPRCLAIFIAQGLSQDDFAESNNMLWAAS